MIMTKQKPRGFIFLHSINGGLTNICFAVIIWTDSVWGENMNIVKVNGLWDDGLVLDNYTKSSKYIGEDSFGNPRFDSVYTEIGNLLHAMKYNGHYNTGEAIIDMCAAEVMKWTENKHIDIIIPVPPTNLRIIQPTFEIAECLAEKLSLPYNDSVLEKIDNRQSKNMGRDNKDLKGTIVQVKPAKRECNILLIDDFYSTGETANECVSVLKRDSLVNKIYYLAIVKTK